MKKTDRKTGMKKMITTILFTLLLSMALACPVFAATSSGSLNITMTYDLKKGTEYIQGNPFLCVFLSNDSGSTHYFVKLKYDGVSKSTAQIKKPVMGKYSVRYFTPKQGKEKQCEKAVTLDAIPDTTIFDELQINKGMRSYYAGGTLGLSSGSTSLTIGSGASSLKIVSKDLFGSFIPAFNVIVTGTNLKKIKGDVFHLYLYRSDKNGTKGKLLDEIAKKKNTFGYFRNIVTTNPGTYYYLVTEKTAEKNVTVDSKVLVETQIGYAGERLNPLRVNITRGKKTRKIVFSSDKSHKLTITLKDPDNKNTKYYIYGPVNNSYPVPKADGTYDSPVKAMTQSGTAYSVTVSPPCISGKDWYSYNIVKKVNGTVQKGFTINIPFRWNDEYKDGRITTSWTVRPFLGFTSICSK
jgi:hypothetical protein